MFYWSASGRQPAQLEHTFLDETKLKNVDELADLLRCKRTRAFLEWLRPKRRFLADLMGWSRVDILGWKDVKWSQVVRLGYLGSDEELETVPVGVQDDQGRSLVLPWKLTSFSSAYSRESMQVTVRLMAPGQQMHTEESELESELESRQDNGFD